MARRYRWLVSEAARVTITAPSLCGTGGYTQQLARLLSWFTARGGGGGCVMGSTATWALWPAFLWGRTGGHTQQLDQASDLLLCLGKTIALTSWLILPID